MDLVSPCGPELPSIGGSFYTQKWIKMQILRERGLLKLWLCMGPPNHYNGPEKHELHALQLCFAGPLPITITEYGPVFISKINDYVCTTFPVFVREFWGEKTREKLATVIYILLGIYSLYFLVVTESSWKTWKTFRFSIFKKQQKIHKVHFNFTFNVTDRTLLLQ